MNHIKLLVLLLTTTVLFAQGQIKQEQKRPDSYNWVSNPIEVSGIEKAQLDLNGEWKFNSAPKEKFWKSSSFSKWKPIEVPGEWLMQGFEVEPGSQAAYTREFNVPEDWKKSTLYLKCDAVFSKAKIWVNGQEVGEHVGPMMAFEKEVTQLLKPGKIK